MLKIYTSYRLLCDYCKNYLTQFRQPMITTKESELYEVARAKHWEINLGSEYREKTARCLPCRISYYSQKTAELEALIKEYDDM